MKTCTLCGQEKNLDDFAIQRTGKMGKHAHCKDCKRKDTNGRYSTPKQKAKTLKRYGLTLEVFNKMVEDQESKCKICEKVTTYLCVDHDHLTGRVRGLLCHHCNTGLGLLGDSSKNLQRALEYLEE